MTGSIANGRKGPSEAGRYTYLNFGGRGIQFKAKMQDFHVGLKATSRPTKPTFLKLIADEPLPTEAPFFEENGEDMGDYSLCYPFKYANYWVREAASGRDEQIVAVVSYGIYADIYLDNEKVVSSAGVVLSASLIRDEIEGDCIFYTVCSGSYYPEWGYYSYYYLIWPLTFFVWSVRTKSVVRSWQLKPEDVLTRVSYSIVDSHQGKAVFFYANGGHTADGRTFQFCHIDYDEAAKKTHLLFISVGVNGGVSVDRVDQTGGEQKIDYNIINGMSQRTSSTTGDATTTHSEASGPNGTATAKLTTTGKVSGVVIRRSLSNGYMLDITMSGDKKDNTTYTLTQNSSSENTRVRTGGGGEPRVPLVETSDGSVEDEKQRTKARKAYDKRILTLWQGVEVVLSNMEYEENNSFSSRDNYTYHTVTVDDVTTVADRTEDKSMSDSRKRLQTYTTGVISAINFDGMLAVVSYTKIVRDTVATYAGTTENTIRFYGPDAYLLSVKEVATYTRWMEIVEGSSVTKVAEEVVVKTTEYLASEYWNSSWWGSGPEAQAYQLYGNTPWPAPGNSNNSSWTTENVHRIYSPLYTYYIASDSSSPFYLFHAKHSHLVSLGDASMVAVPLMNRGGYSWPTIDPYYSTLPNTTRYYVSLSPKGAGASSTKELTDAITDFNRVVGVRPVT